jgi:ribonucleotide monophosphatase NagD (HAD superfamily)
MIDHVKDSNHAYLYNLDKDEGLPEFVKQATLLDENQAQLLGSNLFADKDNRLFPTTTKADTWTSAAYYEKYAKESYEEKEASQIESKLRDMCSFWGVDYPQVSVVEKEASAHVDIEYRYDGAVQTRVRVQNGEQLEKLASFVTTSAKELPWEMRREAARQILDNQNSFSTVMNQNLLADLHKTAGYGVGALPDVLKEVKKRQIHLGNAYGKVTADNLNALSDLAKEASQAGIVAPDALDKIAAALDAVDKMLKLGDRYGNGINPPENALFSFSSWDLEQFDKEAVQLPSGQTVSNSMLEEYPVRTFMGEFLGGTPEQGHAKEAAGQLTPRQSAKVYNFIQTQKAV